MSKRHQIGDEVSIDGEWYVIATRTVTAGRVYLMLRDENGYESEVRPSELDKD